MKAHRFLRALRLLAIAGSINTGFAVAQSAPQITQPVDPGVRHTLANSVPAQVHRANDLGRVSGSLVMNDMLLQLKPTAAQETALAAYLADVQNSGSPIYHHWLTPAEFGARFGASDADLEKVTAWLASNGLSVTEVAQGKRWIRFSGNSAQVERAFGTEMHHFAAAGKTRYANATTISIPEALSPAVSGLVSLNNFEKAAQHTPVTTVARNNAGKLVRKAGQTGGGAKPEFTAPGFPEEIFLAPGDFAKIYNTTPLLGGSNGGAGVSIAIAGRSDISLSDVESFRTLFSLPFNDPSVIHANDDPGVVPGDDEEAILDVEWSGAVAPQAKINYVIGGTTTTTDGVDIASSYIVDHVVAPIMSVSFGGCEQGVTQGEIDFYHDLWQQAVAEGITVFVSAGDSGSSDCTDPSLNNATPFGLGVNALASTPFNVAVGGTEFADTDLPTFWNTAVAKDLSSAKGYVPEVVWNESCNLNLPISLGNCYFSQAQDLSFAGGGGASSCAVHVEGSTPNYITGLYQCAGGHPKPSWQTGTGVPQDGVRDLPDLSLAAAGNHDGFLLCYDGSCQYTKNSDGTFTLTQAAIVGGTSAASPSMAGIMALLEEKNGSFQGQANDRFYKLAARQSSLAACNSSKEADPSQQSACVFHDVTAGTNTLSCGLGRTDCSGPVDGSPYYGVLPGYRATKGYDLASGLGSVDAANLVAAWGALASTPTATSLSVSKTSFVHGSTVTVTAQVLPAPGNGTPTGEITFKADGAGVPVGPLFAGSLASGRLAESVSSLPGGTYNLTAQYGGDGTYSGSTSDPVTLTVTREAGTLEVQTLVAANLLFNFTHPIVPGTQITLGNSFYFQGQVGGRSGAGAATGTVVLSEGGKQIGRYPLDRNGAFYIQCGPQTPCDYPVGTYNFTVQYAGDSSFEGISETVPFTLTKGPAEYEIVVSTQTPRVNATVVARVFLLQNSKFVPTGRVNLVRADTQAVLGSGAISASGGATISFAAPPGTYELKATYAGDANYSGLGLGNYLPTIETSDGAATTVVVRSTALTATLGSRTGFDIAVNAVKTSGSFPTGTVTFRTIYGDQTAPETLIGGHLTTFLSWGSAGQQTIFVTYNGDATFAPSVSRTIEITVAKATPSLRLQPRSGQVKKGAEASITALLTSTLANNVAAAPTGTVQFYDSVNGAAVKPLGTPQALNSGNGGAILATIAPVLPEGENRITAIYSGDANWIKATAREVRIVVRP